MNKELLLLLRDVAFAVLPISLVVCGLQFALLHMPGEVFARFLLGALFVGGGLFLFLFGVNTGLLPMGEMIGAELPNRGSVVFLLFMSFVLGVTITVAEPNVLVLARQIGATSNGLVPRGMLILAVALSVGVCVAGAVLRIVVGVPIAKVLMGGYALILALSFVTPPEFLPVAYDAGGVTTGPVTVPFIIALGLGTAGVLQGRSALADGFGLVGLTVMGPIIGVMTLGMIYG